MKIKKLFLVLGVILFSLVISGCTSNSFEIEEGIYICDSYDYYGELELKKISENEFVNSNGLNVFKVNYDGGRNVTLRSRGNTGDQQAGSHNHSHKKCKNFIKTLRVVISSS